MTAPTNPKPDDSNVVPIAFSSRPPDRIHEGGYVRIYRREFTERDSVFGTNRILIGVWTEVISRAAWKPVKIHIGESWLRLERKQLIIDFVEWAKNWRLSEMQLRYAFKRMADHGRITMQVRPVDAGLKRKVTVVTVVNYDLYNPPEPHTTFKDPPKTESKANGGLHAYPDESVKDRPKNKNPKEEKEGKNGTESRSSSESPDVVVPNPTPSQTLDQPMADRQTPVVDLLGEPIRQPKPKPLRNDQLDAEFQDHFWPLWNIRGTKRGKGQALLAWRKARRSKATVDDICSALNAHIRRWRQNETELRFIPHPATWLNGCRWEDDATPEPVPIVMTDFGRYGL